MKKPIGMSFTPTGYENKVKVTLIKLSKIAAFKTIFRSLYSDGRGRRNQDGKRKTSMKKIYPGYVMIKMVLTDEIWYIVRNTRGVTGCGPELTPGP